MSTDDTRYREVAWQLIEWGRKRAEVEAVDRDQMIWDAHQAGMAKAEIARLTGLHWATVDRAVREMESQSPNGSSEGGQES